jgi:hypothetical protein
MQGLRRNGCLFVKVGMSSLRMEIEWSLAKCICRRYPCLLLVVEKKLLRFVSPMSGNGVDSALPARHQVKVV